MSVGSIKGYLSAYLYQNKYYLWGMEGLGVGVDEEWFGLVFIRSELSAQVRWMCYRRYLKRCNV